MTSPKTPTPQRLLTDCHDLGALLDDLRAESVFLVADSIGYESSGASAILEPILRGRLAWRFEVLEPNPQWPGVLDCVGAIQKAKPGAVVAVGGSGDLVGQEIKKSRVVGSEDLGMEAIYEFEVEDMPVTVAVDSQGTSVHQTGPAKWKEIIAEKA